MTDIAIRVQNLGKQYRIGRAQQRHDTLRDALTAGVRAPVERLSSIVRRPSSDDEDRPKATDDRFWALRDVSFDVHRGEVIGIIGRNGAGKSTLLKILSRITEPTEGRAELHGRIASLLEVGTGFHPELTGRENIYLSGAMLGMRRAEIDRRFDEIVDFSGVEKFIDTPIKRYSSGMNVRLGFAVAAHLDPEILLVDEVLAVGDFEFQKKCLGKMGEVASEGRTVCLVSHNLPYITHVCQRAVLLASGKVVADDDAIVVVDQYVQSTQRDCGNGILSFDTSRRLEADGIMIPKVEVLSMEGSLLANVRGGQSIRVRIHFAFNRVFEGPSFAVTFSTARGVEILRLSTLPISGFDLPSLSGTGYVDCVIERMPFTGGVYVLGVGIGRPNVEYLIFDDEVGQFEIPPYDAYESGFGVDQRCGVVTSEHHWELTRSQS